MAGLAVGLEPVLERIRASAAGLRPAGMWWRAQAG